MKSWYSALFITQWNLVRFSKFLFLQKACENRHMAKYWVRKCTPCAPSSTAPAKGHNWGQNLRTRTFDAPCSLTFLGTGFLKKDWNHSPNSNQKIWRTNGLRMGTLLGVISDIHRVHTNPEDPMNVRNNASKVPVLKPYVPQIFRREFWEWFQSF